MLRAVLPLAHALLQQHALNLLPNLCNAVLPVKMGITLDLHSMSLGRCSSLCLKQVGAPELAAARQASAGTSLFMACPMKITKMLTYLSCVARRPGR